MHKNKGKRNNLGDEKSFSLKLYGMLSSMKRIY